MSSWGGSLVRGSEHLPSEGLGQILEGLLTYAVSDRLTLNQLRLQREMQALDQVPSDLHSILLQEQTQAQA